MRQVEIKTYCSECGNHQVVKAIIDAPQTIVCPVCGTTYGLEVAEVESKDDDDDYCYYCKDAKATCCRSVPIRRKNGYKLCNFEAHLCDGCNNLSGDFLSDYFSI